MGWGLRCALLWVSILAVVTNAEGSWQVEHAFGDDAFSPAGTLSESVQGLQLIRDVNRKGDSPLLQQLISRGGFYKIRVTGAESQPIHAAVPARCLQPGEKLNAVMTASGEIAGISYDLSGAACDPSSSDAGAAGVSLSAKVPVAVVKPVPAFTLRQQPKPLDGSKPGARSATTAAQKAAPAQGQPKSKTGKDEEEAEAEKPPDTRTWLQKNWIFIIPALLMLVNGFGGAQQRARANTGPAAQQPRPRQSR
ncbi:g3997 [Coccomyxa viridis]|uniref:ER membrane protein complex subunit 10 n=1 Tax=Coccomyxa viridis TaxID=1274662 RepID=A0ABP1FW37_9CHLO